MRVTWSEINAWVLLHQGAMTNEPSDIHGAADAIIALAEQIKAERATAAMEESKRIL
jgi:hypothetical protein